MNPIQILDRPIAFHRSLVKITGSVHAALMLSQAIYWSNRATRYPDGWFWKTAEDWEEETGLTRREQEGARRTLRATGFWQEERREAPAKLFFRVDKDKLANSLAALDEQGNGKSDLQFRQKGKSSFDKKVKLDSTKAPN